MQKILNILTYLLFLTNLLGQTGTLVQNEDFLWIGETNLEYIFENSDRLDFDYRINKIDNLGTNSSSTIVKIDMVDDSIMYPCFYLGNKLLDLILDGKMSVKYLDKDSIMTREEIRKKLYISPIQIGENKIQVVSGNIYNFYSYFIKQIWYFDVKNKKIIAIPIELTPVYDTGGKKEKIFRIILPIQKRASKNRNFHDEKFEWIKQSIDRISLKTSFTLKSDNFENFFFNYLMNTSFLCDDTYYYPNTKCNNSTKISIIDADSFEIKETENPLSKIKIPFKDITGIKIEQLWYFDKTENNIGTEIKNISPLVLRTFGTNGRTKIHVPIFTIKN